MKRQKYHQIVHGLPYKPRQKQPSMYQILSWNQQPILIKNKNSKSCYSHNNIEQYQINNLQSFSKINNPNNNLIQTKTNQQNLQKNKTNNAQKPHSNHQLYFYDDNYKHQNLKKDSQNKNKKTKQRKQTLSLEFKQKKDKQKRLDPNNQEDKKQIQQRKKIINKFDHFTRDLPDSAFTTYYGKPPFSFYGIGNESKSIQKKTFNIMPHAGPNHPKKIQTFKSALRKGKQIKQTFIPKVPLETQKQITKDYIDSQYYHIPIIRPDLINTNRFSKQKQINKNKQRTPTHNELNFIPQRPKLKIIQPSSPHSVKKNELKKIKSSQNISIKRQEYPEISHRTNLKQILDQKKRQEHKLPYKVTQCYPLSTLQSLNLQKKQKRKINRWLEAKPAGIKTPRSDHVSDIFSWTNLYK